MKLYLSNAAFYNRAPFEKLEMHFEENEIAVLTAVNGRGKTTILSHIVDAFHEMARPFFQGDFKGKENQLYLLSSGIDNFDLARPSLVYLRFKTTSEEFFDYVNVRGTLTEDEYNAFDLPTNKIQFVQLKASIDSSNCAIMVFPSLDKKKRNQFLTPTY